MAQIKYKSWLFVGLFVLSFTFFFSLDVITHLIYEKVYVISSVKLTLIKSFLESTVIMIGTYFVYRYYDKKLRTVKD